MKPTKVKFNFRAKDITDNEGNVIGKKPKLPMIELDIPYLETTDLLSLIENGGKQLELLLEAANDLIYQATRDVITEAAETGKAISQSVIDMSLPALSWEAIANRPKAERRSSAVSKEDLELFVEDYKSVMSVVMADKTEAQIEVAARHISKKFAECRFNKPVIETLRSYLATWFSHTPNKEDFATVYEVLDNRASVLLAADESSRLAESI